MNSRYFFFNTNIWVIIFDKNINVELRFRKEKITFNLPKFQEITIYIQKQKPYPKSKYLKIASYLL